MWQVPGSQLRYITNKSQGVRDKTLGLIVHVQAGNGELTGWYNNPGSDASSAWQVMKTGNVFQFGDPDVDKFWTQAAGNPDYGAAEGEGFPNEPMTDAQLDGFAEIYAKGHVEEGWPFQLAEKPGDRGLGWHGMGGAAWGGHYNCPGDIRKAQRPEILRRAQLIVNQGKDEVEMATIAELGKLLDGKISAIAVKVWRTEIYNPLVKSDKYPQGTPVEALTFLQSINTNAYGANLKASAALALIQAQNENGKPLTADQINAIVNKAVADAINDKISDATVVLGVKE